MNKFWTSYGQDMKKNEQAGAELGQAQLKLGSGLTWIELNEIDKQVLLLAKFTVTNHFRSLNTKS